MRERRREKTERRQRDRQRKIQKERDRTRVPPFPSARCFMDLTQLAIHDGVLGEMKFHDQFSQDIHVCLVPVVVIVKSERQVLCVKSPEVFLEKKVSQRAETD